MVQRSPGCVISGVWDAYLLGWKVLLCYLCRRICMKNCENQGKCPNWPTSTSLSGASVRLVPSSWSGTMWLHLLIKLFNLNHHKYCYLEYLSAFSKFILLNHTPDHKRESIVFFLVPSSNHWFALATPVTCNLAGICLFASTHHPVRFENAEYARC